MFYNSFSSFFFFHREIFEVCGLIFVKICHIVGSMFNLQMLVGKFEGVPPQKIFRVKNVQNLA